MINSTRRGGGITARCFRSFEPSLEGISAGLEAVAGRRGFEGKVLEIESMAKDILAMARREGSLRPMEDDTPEDYAHQILKRIETVRTAIKEADSDGAARWAIELGYLCCEFAMKFEFERPALFGQRILAKLELGREVANGTRLDRQHRRQRHRAAFDQARAKGLSKMRAYEEAGRKCGVSSKTIQRSIKQHTKN